MTDSVSAKSEEDIEDGVLHTACSMYQLAGRLYGIDKFMFAEQLIGCAQSLVREFKIVGSSCLIQDRLEAVQQREKSLIRAGS